MVLLGGILLLQDGGGLLLELEDHQQLQRALLDRVLRKPALQKIGVHFAQTPHEVERGDGEQIDVLLAQARVHEREFEQELANLLLFYR